MGPGKISDPKPPTCVSHPELPDSGRRTSKSAPRLPTPAHPGVAPCGWASRSLGGSEPPRDFHDAPSPSGKPRQGWDVGPRERAQSRAGPGTLTPHLTRCFPQSPEDDDRKVRRREKNRVAAQRSRKKQTQKADKLHEEHECLEQENTVLRREIGKLTEEIKHLSAVLKEHEKTCPLLLCPMNFVPLPRPDPVAGCLPR
ncbi:PREDICTED: basic leucine zipper transcriptional factor ATF-like 3 [Galeopterus variegatus]|uniref:Basic leucine zipper transcriptional factor ATF-like 3 n=1 Tax=Galeopterus variegatus TaxID=482537 RepID=A0ABM0RLK1_GALVR|nr:PREDICTED: basic leucine zipper transcriptional factor ATF-like 3 [Galeopterus variegatus]